MGSEMCIRDRHFSQSIKKLLANADAVVATAAAAAADADAAVAIAYVSQSPYDQSHTPAMICLHWWLIN